MLASNAPRIATVVFSLLLVGYVIYYLGWVMGLKDLFFPILW